MPGITVPEAVRARVSRSILTRNLGVRRGERVAVESWTHSLPWAVSIAREARRLGALPLVLYEDEDAYWDAVDDGGSEIVGAPAAHEFATLTKTDVFFHLWGPGVGPRFAALPAKTQERLLAFNEPWYEAARRSGLRGARLDIGRPRPELARAYGVSEAAWLDQVIRASLVDPRRLAAAAAPIARALERGRTVRVRDDRGTDLRLGLARRPAQQMVGTVAPPARRGRYDMLTSVPSGLVRVGLDEAVADGTFVSNRSNFYEDGTATGATFHFSKGRLTEATFDRGGERFSGPYRSGGKGRDRPGRLGIGLNPALRNTPQLEDVERGAVLVSVGGNRNLGGRNASPFFGFAISAGATVEVDGRKIVP
jgi:leucyl aminopeptidase (aminopeptidase T)